ncbi:uncharacterized protein LOC110925156 [Helianthus annuus]|uniref:uncharacterized protein LOC110925156 n=1 Tax=Helianthus annuus TaxID=4232 RepID=UPI000B8FE16B|nr:uncharacterized protein LOC110925156 [Helianthus annuus]
MPGADKPESSDSDSKPNLLHPAYSVTNIQSKIRTLDGTTVPYSAWVKIFKLHVVAYKVSAHIDGTAARSKTDPTYESWLKLDALVLQWIWSTVSDDLLPRVMDSDGTARGAWVKLEKIYLSNKKARAAALVTKFVNLTLTACSSLDAYCQKLKELANQLEDVDQPISESRLVLQLVRGLPQEFDTTASLINSTNDDWDQARSMLTDELIRIEARISNSSSVMVATGPSNRPSQQQSSQQQPQSWSQQQPPAWSSQQPQPPNFTRGRGRG